MSNRGRGHRGAPRGSPRGRSRGRGGGTPRGRGYGKRPMPESHDFHGAPQPKSFRGMGSQSRGSYHSSGSNNWMRDSDNDYPSQPQMMHHHYHQQQQPSTSSSYRHDHYDDNDGQHRHHNPYEMQMPLPKPIPTRRDDHYDHHMGGGMSPSSSGHSGSGSRPDYYYDQPQYSPPLPPPISPPPPQNYGTPYVPKRGRSNRGGRGAKRGIRGSTPTRGKKSPASTRGSRGGGRNKPSALERLGPKINDKSNRGRSKATTKLPAAKPATNDEAAAASASTEQAKPSTSKEAKKQTTERFVFKEGDKVVIICRHCELRTSDWMVYKTHLTTSSHTSSLRGLKNKLHQKIGNLRTSQRRKQNQLTKQMEQDGSLYDSVSGQRRSTLFCKLCKLVFNQSREEHNATDDHKLIHAFLNPECSICSATFKTPMSYEKHLCSVKHLKKELDPKAEVEENDDENLAAAGDEFNPDEFVTLDEVTGDDEEDDDEPEESENIEPEKMKMEEPKIEDKIETKEKVRDQIKGEVKNEIKEEVKGEIKNEVKEEIKREEEVITLSPDQPVGLEYVRQVVMFYCDLCHKYLPKLSKGDPDELVDSHCTSEKHQNAFIKKESEKRKEESEALKLLAKEEAGANVEGSFNEDQLDYEAESINGDVKSETSEK